MLKNSRGFTILEIIVVITVIGILAGLVLNVFDTIQQRGRNAGLLRIVKQYETALLAYKADNGEYPPMPLESTCLGTGYDDRDDDDIGDCNLDTVLMTTDTDFNEALAPYFSEALPAAGNYNFDPGFGGPMWQGVIVIDARGVNGEIDVAGETTDIELMVVFLLQEAGQDCQRTVVTNIITDPWADFTGYSETDSGSTSAATACAFALY